MSGAGGMGQIRKETDKPISQWLWLNENTSKIPWTLLNDKLKNKFQVQKSLYFAIMI